MVSILKRLRATSHNAMNSSDASGLLSRRDSLSQRAHRNIDPATTAPASSLPVVASFDSSHLLIGAGVVIFHVVSSRVVLCYHSVDQYWFLPKGRRDAGEDSGAGAEREGFEEVIPMRPSTIRSGSNSFHSLATVIGFCPFPSAIASRTLRMLLPCQASATAK